MFKVAIRAISDRFFKLLEKFEKNEREEARASCIQSVESDKLNIGIADINKRMAEAKKI